MSEIYSFPQTTTSSSAWAVFFPEFYPLMNTYFFIAASVLMVSVYFEMIELLPLRLGGLMVSAALRKMAGSDQELVRPESEKA